MRVVLGALFFSTVLGLATAPPPALAKIKDCNAIRIKIKTDDFEFEREIDSDFLVEEFAEYIERLGGDDGDIEISRGGRTISLRCVK